MTPASKSGSRAYCGGLPQPMVRPNVAIADDVIDQRVTSATVIAARVSTGRAATSATMPPATRRPGASARARSGTSPRRSTSAWRCCTPACVAPNRMRQRASRHLPRWRGRHQRVVRQCRPAREQRQQLDGQRSRAPRLPALIRRSRRKGGASALEVRVESLPALEVVVLQLRGLYGVARQPHGVTALEHERHGVFDLVRL